MLSKLVLIRSELKRIHEFANVIDNMHINGRNVKYMYKFLLYFLHYLYNNV